MTKDEYMNNLLCTNFDNDGTELYTIDELSKAYDEGYNQRGKREAEETKDLRAQYAKDGEKIADLGNYISDLEEKYNDAKNKAEILAKENKRLQEDYDNVIFTFQDTLKASAIKENVELKRQIEDFRNYTETLSENHTNEWWKQQEVITSLRCCANCAGNKPCVTVNETIGNMCENYTGGKVCDNWRLIGLTDGNKAEDYWHLNHNVIQLYDNDEKRAVIVAYKDGLAKGRKEQFEQDNKCCANCMTEGKVSELEVDLEIKEGFIKYWKKLCKDKSNDVIELQKEIAKLRERLDSVNQTNNYYEEKERYALQEHNENIQLKSTD